MEDIKPRIIVYRVIFLGNPGNGKSTLCNALLGEIHFTSGATGDGKGVTTKFEFIKSPHGFYISDTPGLADIKLKK